MSDRDKLLSPILLQALGHEQEVISISPLGGGCINETLKVLTTEGRFFIKLDKYQFADMFDKEVMGLELLRGCRALKVPEVFGSGVFGQVAFLVMEYLEPASSNESYWRQLGLGLSELHRITSSQYGLDHHNYIGRLNQQNTVKDTWLQFLIRNRLETQFKMALQNGVTDQYLEKNFEAFLNRLPAILPASAASLLHGDLWNGNVMSSTSGAAIFDPAVYYGAREMDLAMTRLFGGFDGAFYKAYDEAFPLPDSYTELEDLYQLYPLLVHLNLFGSGYLSAVNRVIKRYL